MDFALDLFQIYLFTSPVLQEAEERARSMLYWDVMNGVCILSFLL